jgi:hypothetical protein
MNLGHELYLYQAVPLQNPALDATLLEIVA